MREQGVAQEERGHQAGEAGDGHELRGARLAVEPFLGELLVLLEQRDLLLFLVVLELHAQLRHFANAIERALFAHAPQVFALVGERRRVVADRGVRARAQLVELGDVVGRLRAARRDGAVELRHGFLRAAEREVQPAAQRRERAVVVVVHAAGLAQRELGAIAPARRPRLSALRSICTPHMRICERPVPTRSPMLSWMRSASVRGDQRLVEPARGLEDRGAAIERRREADLRLLFAEERDGFIDQRQRLRIVAHGELRHRQAARGHHGFFAARIPPQQRIGAQQVVERLVGIAVAEIQPAAIAQHAAERQRPVADRVDDARELDRGGVDAADIGADQRAHGAHADREVGHVTGRQQREAGVRVRDALAAEAELARGIGGDGVQRRAARGRHVGGGGNGVGELRQGRGRIAEGALFDVGEIAALRADAGRMCLRQYADGQRQQAADPQPDLPGIRADHGA